MSPRASLPDCKCYGTRSVNFECPRHGLKQKPSTGKPTTRKTVKPVSETRIEEKKDWALIKRTLIVAQKRYVGHTFCECCKVKTPASQLDCDHIVPSGDGGPWKPGNAQLLRRPCHETKHGTQPKWTKKRKAS